MVGLQKAMSKIMHGCLAFEHGINVDLCRIHTVECRPTNHSTSVTESLWTVRNVADWIPFKRCDSDDGTPQESIREEKKGRHRRGRNQQDVPAEVSMPLASPKCHNLSFVLGPQNEKIQLSETTTATFNVLFCS